MTTPKIGNRKTATELVRLNAWGNATFPQPSNGWEEIGGGSFRTAWLHLESDVVYKYEIESYDNDYGSRREVLNAQMLRRRAKDTPSKHIRIPLTSGYNIKLDDGEYYIVAMEMVKGTLGMDGITFNKAARRELYRLGFGDMHGKNYIQDENKFLVPIDLASPRSRSQADRRCLAKDGFGYNGGPRANINTTPKKKRKR